MDVNFAGFLGCVMHDVRFFIGSTHCLKKQLVVPIGVLVKDAAKVKVQRKSNVIVYSGHLTKESGVQLALEALPKLVKLFPEIELRIIGNGPVEDALHKRVKELKLEEHVNFTGFINTTTHRTKWLKLLKQRQVQKHLH